MKELYNETFDKLTLSDAKRNELRYALSKSKEATPKWRHYNIARITAVAAAVALILLAIPSTRAGIAKAANYMKNIFLVADGTEAVATSNPESTEVTFEAEAFAEDKYYEILDKRIYFVLDTVRIDITDKCSNSTYYRYDLIDKNGYEHIIFVGGDIENLGWAEFIFDSNGTYLTNLMSVPEENYWLENAMVSIGVPTGNPNLDFSN